MISKFIQDMVYLEVEDTTIFVEASVILAPM